MSLLRPERFAKTVSAGSAPIEFHCGRVSVKRRMQKSDANEDLVQ